jgi:hypothetical protein
MATANCSLGVFFGPAFENTDIPRKDYEVGTDLHDPVSVHFGFLPSEYRKKCT